MNGFKIDFQRHIKDSFSEIVVMVTECTSGLMAASLKEHFIWIKKRATGCSAFQMEPSLRLVVPYWLINFLFIK